MTMYMIMSLLLWFRRNFHFTLLCNNFIIKIVCMYVVMFTSPFQLLPKKEQLLSSLRAHLQNFICTVNRPDHKQCVSCRKGTIKKKWWRFSSSGCFPSVCTFTCCLIYRYLVDTHTRISQSETSHFHIYY